MIFSLLFMLICLCTRTDPQQMMMWECSEKKSLPTASSPPDRPDVGQSDTSTTNLWLSHPIYYSSDLSDDDANINDEASDNGNEPELNSSCRNNKPPRLKQH